MNYRSFFSILQLVAVVALMCDGDHRVEAVEYEKARLVTGAVGSRKPPPNLRSGQQRHRNDTPPLRDGNDQQQRQRRRNTEYFRSQRTTNNLHTDLLNKQYESTQPHHHKDDN